MIEAKNADNAIALVSIFNEEQGNKNIQTVLSYFLHVPK